MSFTKAYGKYFDGHTSKPYDVELEIWPEKKFPFFIIIESSIGISRKFLLKKIAIHSTLLEKRITQRV